MRPLLVKVVLDKSHYLLANWCGKLLPFFHVECIHRFKPCYLSLGQEQNKSLTTVSNFQGFKNELQAFEQPWWCINVYYQV